jgi:hypothetical protein
LGALERLHGAGVVDVHERVELPLSLAAHRWLWRSALGPVDDADRALESISRPELPAPTSSSASLRLAVRGRRRLLDDGRHPAAEALARFDDYPPRVDPGALDRREERRRPAVDLPEAARRQSRPRRSRRRSRSASHARASSSRRADRGARLGRRRGDPSGGARGDVTEAVLEREPGDRVAVTVQRDGEHRTIEVRLGEQPRRAP